jgi:hypothetical protein
MLIKIYIKCATDQTKHDPRIRGAREAAGPRERHVTWRARRARGVESVAAAASLPASGWAARQAAAPSPSLRRPGVDDAVVCHFFGVESGNCLGILGAWSFLLPSVPPAVRPGVFFYGPKLEYNV